MNEQQLRQLYPWMTDAQVAQRLAQSSSALRPHQRALLDTISGPESAGKYNVIYGGQKFSDYSRHPGVNVPIKSGPNVGKTSSAAGKYQFITPTWNTYQKKLNLPDFSPASQDQAAWALARDDYQRIAGGDLDKVLQSGDPNALAGVGKALRGTWTSLPGGIEQGTNVNKFVSTYNNYLGRPTPVAQAPVAQVAQQANASRAATQMAQQQAAAKATSQMTSQNVATQLAANQAAATQIATAPVKATANPFGGLVSALMMSKMAQAAPAKVAVNNDAIEPGVGGNGQPIDPEQETIMTSHTPNAYLRRRRMTI